MEVRNKFTMCRLCLCENECFINIFVVNDRHGYVAAEVIYNLLQFHASETDGYPHVVCPACLAKLSDFKTWKERCRMSKEIYDNIFATGDRLVEEQPQTVLAQGIKVESLDIEEESNHYSQDRVQEIKEESLDIEEDSDLHSQAVDPAGWRLTPPESASSSRGADGIDNQTATTPPSKKVVHHLERHPQDHPSHFCDSCGKGFVSADILAAHLLTHALERPYKCGKCEATFKRTSNLKQHMAVHSGLRPYQCRECNLCFGSVGDLEQHMKNHSKYKPYQCTECNRSFSEKCLLRRHMVCHTGIRSYRCFMCVASFGRKDHLRRHVRMHAACDSGERRARQSVLPKERPVPARTDTQDGMQEMEADCVDLAEDSDNNSEHLPQEIKSESPDVAEDLDYSQDQLHEIKPESVDIIEDLQHHTLAVEESGWSAAPPEISSSSRATEPSEPLGQPTPPKRKPHVCKFCGKEYASSSLLHSHLRIHTEQRPYKCNQCDAAFKRSSNLRQHFSVHSGVKPYQCGECNMCFGRADDLHQHAMTHSTIKPYRCTECDRSFTKNCLLRRHMVSHTGIRSYKCKLCGASYGRRDHLKRHIKVHGRRCPQVRQDLPPMELSFPAHAGSAGFAQDV